MLGGDIPRTSRLKSHLVRHQIPRSQIANSEPALIFAKRWRLSRPDDEGAVHGKLKQTKRRVPVFQQVGTPTGRGDPPEISAPMGDRVTKLGV